MLAMTYWLEYLAIRALAMPRQLLWERDHRRHIVGVYGSTGFQQFLLKHLLPFLLVSVLVEWWLPSPTARRRARAALGAVWGVLWIIWNACLTDVWCTYGGLLYSSSRIESVPGAVDWQWKPHMWLLMGLAGWWGGVRIAKAMRHPETTGRGFPVGDAATPSSPTAGSKPLRAAGMLADETADRLKEKRK